MGGHKRWTIKLDSITLKGNCNQTWVTKIEEEDAAVHVCIRLPKVHYGWPSIGAIVHDLKAVPWIVSTHVNVTPHNERDPGSVEDGELRCIVNLDKLLEHVPNPRPVAEPGSTLIDSYDKEELFQWCNGQSTTTGYISVDQFRDDSEYWGYAATIWMKLVRKYVAKYDAFISHASEDKASIVRPIADRLVAAGFRIWYDEFELKVGDSLIESIDRGLSTSRYAIVVLSEQFFKKEWTKRELAGLTTLELQYKKARFVLPIWYRVSKEAVAAISPPLADKVAIVSDGSDVETVAKRLVDIIGAQQKLR